MQNQLTRCNSARAISLLFLACMAVLCITSGPVHAQGGRAVRGLQPTFQDPAVPMIALPTDFSTHRENRDGKIPSSGKIVLADLEGPGCVRHLWLLYGKGYRLEVTVDGAKTPQIDMPVDRLFGVMHDLKPYPIDCSAFTVLPNPDEHIKGNPGYNLWMPIPFQKSCRITLHSQGGNPTAAMVNWHKYDERVTISPFRLHTEYRTFKPAPPRGGFAEMANIAGRGFIAGVVTGYIQQNHSCMVYHTMGMTILIDGETEPHVIRGHNVEDDYGFTWGFHEKQTRWIGCPYRVYRGVQDQDGVFYRFFGPDPIAFDSSLVFRNGARGDDMETVVYYYKIDGTEAARISAPAQWQVTGPFPGGDNWDAFKKSEFVESLEPGDWPDKLENMDVSTVSTDRGWIDLHNMFFARQHPHTPHTLLDHSAYARTTVESDVAGTAVLKLTVDDWCIVWLNGEKLATLRHEAGLKTVRIPVKLKKGSNELLIKTNNSDQPPNKRLWVINCIIENR